MRAHVIGVLFAVASMSCQGTPPGESAEAPPDVALASALTEAAPDPRDQFIGTWKLVGVERYDADDDLLPTEPGTFGAGEPLGYIMYDGEHMGVVIQQEGRQPYASDQRTPDEALAAITSYTSYFGPYSVNEAESYVTHHVEGHLRPAGTGQDNQRFYEFSGNQLALKPPRAASGVQTSVVWEKMRERPGLTAADREFLGFWEYDHSERRTLDGESLDANQFDDGYILYMPSGVMAVHLTRPGRPTYADARPTPDEAEAAMRTYASYFGPFTLHADDDGRAYVLHHRTGNLGPNGIGVEAQRFYEFRDNQLILMPPAGTADGQPAQSYIHWNRLSSLE